MIDAAANFVASRSVRSELLDGKLVTDPGNTRTGTRDVELTGVYIISVAARLLEMHPQTLRKYERVGLVRPSRTGGHLRLYSDEDLLRLRVIRRLVDELGLNLAGVRLVLDLVGPLRRLVDGAELNTETLDVAAIRATAELGSFLKYVGADPSDQDE